MKKRGFIRMTREMMDDVEFIEVFIKDKFRRLITEAYKKGTKIIRLATFYFYDQDADCFLRNEVVCCFDYKQIKIPRFANPLHRRK